MAKSLILRMLLFAQLARSVQFVCHDGSLATCGDGSVPLLHDTIFARDDLHIRSLCPKSCNVFRNGCDPTTAPTCIYPDPNVRNPRAACACRPGYKASNTANGDTQKHWRLPVADQEHRVWVAEGVKCDALCGGYGAQSCTEVTILGADCVGDGVASGPGGKSSYSEGVGADSSYSNSAAPSSTIAKPYGQNASSTEKYNQTRSTPYEKLRYEKSPLDSDSDSERQRQADTDPLNKPSENDPLGGTNEEDPLNEDSVDLSSSNTATDAYEATESENYDDLFEKAGSNSPKYNPNDESASTTMRDTYTVLDSSTGTDSYMGSEPTPGKDTYTSLSPEDLSSDWEIPKFLSSTNSEDISITDKEGPLPLPVEAPTKDQQQQRRSDNLSWRDQGIQEGWRVYLEQWEWYMSKLAFTSNQFPMDERPGLCPNIQDAVQKGCTRGIEIQNSNCALGNNAADPHCRTSTLDTGCCDDYRKRNQGVWCRGRWSNPHFSQLMDEMQNTCAIVTAGGRSYVKLYQSLLLLDQLAKVMTEGGGGFPFMEKLAEVESMWARWRRGVRELVGGNPGEGLDDLGEIATKVSLGDKGTNGVTWSEALEPLIAKKVDEFMLEAIGVAYDVYAIMREREYLRSISVIQQSDDQSLPTIKAAAKDFARKVGDIMQPPAMKRFDDVRDKATMDAAVEDYRKFLQGELVFRAARAWAVVTRIRRVTGDWT
ncbi:hypothetical protein HJFPF1_04139 [Paramyrothecium foliicola]|nr:hypothetical protein HJFPF1_04139 [Paramyrothecium foliicola]